MRFLASLEQKASTAERAAVPVGARGTPYRVGWGLLRAVRDGWERVVWVNRAVNAIADNASRPPVLLSSEDPTDDANYDDPLLRLLNVRPNTYENAQQFRHRLSSQLLLSRAGAFVEVVRTRGGRPSELHLLPPHLTAPIPDPDTFVSGYEVQVGAERIVLSPEQVLWVRRPHPIDPYLGQTPLEAAGLSVDTDFYARLYNRSFLQNDGRPGGIVAVKGHMSQRDSDELERRFNNPGAAGRTTVLEADGLDFQDIAMTPRDAQYAQLRRITKEEILIAFGTPESIIGNAADRTYANADAESEIFWHVTMLPHLDLVAQAFDSLTAGGDGDGLRLRHDLSSVAVLERFLNEAIERATAQYAAGLITADEWRDVARKSRFGEPMTDTLWGDPSKVPLTGEARSQYEAAAQMAAAAQAATMSPGGGGAPALQAAADPALVHPFVRRRPRSIEPPRS